MVEIRRRMASIDKRHCALPGEKEVREAETMPELNLGESMPKSGKDSQDERLT